MGGEVDALFVGYESQENLGLRYIMAYLERQGFSSRLVAFRDQEPERVVAAAREFSPKLIGFSILFQYTLAEFRTVMQLLRGAGIAAHFTAGGHFPTLRPEQVLSELPELDTVVRFEGELTTKELLEHLRNPEQWCRILGLAFRNPDRVVVNAPRALVSRLDDLPWPVRDHNPTVVRGIRVATMLASRGCHFDCSFCSIRQFYGGAPGPLRRARSPNDVVAEMHHLYEQSGVRVFVFHDDDFAVKTQRQRKWIESFLRNLDQAGLSDRIVWKISCRADDVDHDILARCRDRGLVSVYVGIESGHPAGLATLNKRCTVEQNMAALLTLKDLGLAYDMGFMLIDPDTTVEGFRANLRFLREVADLGGVPISFAKAMPLAGTALERRLLEAHRLTGTATRPDYDLLDPRMDALALFVTLHYSFRNSDPRGLVERLRAAWFDHTLAQTFESGDWIVAYQHALADITDRADLVALDTLDRLTAFVADLPPTMEAVASNWEHLNTIVGREHDEERAIAADLARVLHTFSSGLCDTFSLQDAAMPEHDYVYT